MVILTVAIMSLLYLLMGFAIAITIEKHPGLVIMITLMWPVVVMIFLVCFALALGIQLIKFIIDVWKD